MPKLIAEPAPQRFVRFVMVSGDCMNWMGGVSGSYGRFWDGIRQVQAHRFSYELKNGPIPTGMDLDHLCRNKLCVNPLHLEPVTRRINLLRGDTSTAANAAKTHCPQGHPYDLVNTYVSKKGRRYCMRCIRTRLVSRKQNSIKEGREA